MSAGPFFIPGRRLRRRGSGHGLDDTAELVEHFPELAFAHDQWRAQRERVTDGAERDVVLEKAEVERVHAAFADRVRPAREIDTDSEADRANIEHVRQTFEPHRRLPPRLFQLPGTLEQTLVAIYIKRRKPGGAGKRVRRIGIAVE